MSFDDSIRNFLRTNPQIKKILSIFVVIIAIYILFSDIFLFFNKHEFPLFRIILMILLLIIGILYFSGSLRYDINYDSYKFLKDKIIIDNSHLGCEALCCFLTRSDRVKIKRKSDFLLIFGAITQTPQDLSIIELLDKYDIAMFTKRKSCGNLKFEYKIIDDKLILKLECGDYDNRPIACKKYPQKELLKCLFQQYCSRPLEQVMYFNWSTIFFYAVSKKKYPELKKFAMGEACNYHQNYWLIPIPFEFSQVIPCVSDFT